MFTNKQRHNPLARLSIPFLGGHVLTHHRPRDHAPRNTRELHVGGRGVSHAVDFDARIGPRHARDRLPRTTAPLRVGFQERGDLLELRRRMGPRSDFSRNVKSKMGNAVRDDGRRRDARVWHVWGDPSHLPPTWGRDAHPLYMRKDRFGHDEAVVQYNGLRYALPAQDAAEQFMIF